MLRYSWPHLLTRWPLIEADLCERYGIVWEDDAWDLSWHRLDTLVAGLLAVPPTYLILETEKGGRLVTLHATRIRAAIDPPNWAGSDD